MLGEFGVEQIFIVSKKMLLITNRLGIERFVAVVVVVLMLFYVHGKHLRSCQNGQLT